MIFDLLDDLIDCITDIIDCFVDIISDTVDFMADYFIEIIVVIVVIALFAAMLIGLSHDNTEEIILSEAQKIIESRSNTVSVLTCEKEENIIKYIEGTEEYPTTRELLEEYSFYDWDFAGQIAFIQSLITLVSSGKIIYDNKHDSWMLPTPMSENYVQISDDKWFLH